jgi:hypothetical protein
MKITIEMGDKNIIKASKLEKRMREKLRRR